jgi:hypothetical protein
MTKTFHVDTAEQAFDVLRAESRKGPPRHCSDCQLCCRLLPVPPLGKKAGERCQHQKFGKGCAVYLKQRMPMACRLWNCRWLVNDDTADLSRPDRSHYVIDLMSDFITLEDNATKQRTTIQVVQIWIDPAYPDAHRDPHLRQYLLRRSKEGFAAMVRYDARRAIILFPPSMVSGTPPEGWQRPDGWIEVPYDSPNVVVEHDHRAAEIAKAIIDDQPIRNR